MDVGFREEMFDIIIKFEREKGFYVANPWIAYPWLGGIYPKEHPEMQKLKLDASECIIKAELEAINLGKRKYGYFILRDKGTRISDVEILPLDC
jgi:hypothetical protein